MTNLVLTTNPTTITSNVTFAGTAVYGGSSTTWTVVNAATIKGTGASGIGVFIIGGTVANAAGAYIYGYQYGVELRHGLVSNSGTIEGKQKYGVLFNGGTGSVSNAGLIQGNEGLQFLQTGIVSNAGTIAATASTAFFCPLARSATPEPPR